MLKFSLNQIKSVSQLQKHYRSVIQAAKKEPVLITVNNRPEVVIIGVNQIKGLTRFLVKKELEKNKKKTKT